MDYFPDLMDPMEEMTSTTCSRTTTSIKMTRTMT